MIKAILKSYISEKYIQQLLTCFSLPIDCFHQTRAPNAVSNAVRPSTQIDRKMQNFIPMNCISETELTEEHRSINVVDECTVNNNSMRNECVSRQCAQLTLENE